MNSLLVYKLAPAAIPFAIHQIARRFPHCPFFRALAFATRSLRFFVMSVYSAPRTPTPTTICSLPREILVHIFLLSAQRTGPPGIMSSEVVISISHVCSTWRQLALSSGELWTNVAINFPITIQELDRAKEWIRRSSPYPLDIAVDVRDPDWNFNEESHPVQWLQMQAVMGVILPAAVRWQEVKVSADNWQPLHAFLHYTQNVSVPILRGLRLSRCNPYFAAPHQVFVPSESRGFLPLLGGRDLEELTSVELEGVHVDWTSAALRGLTRLSLGYHPKDVTPTITEFRDFLNSCPELDSFTLVGWGPRLNEGSTFAEEFRSSIQLPRLKNLELGVMVPSYAINLLTLFVVPALQSLTIDDITRYDSQALSSPDFGPIFDFLSEQLSSSRFYAMSTKSLSSLTIMNLDPGAMAFQRFLSGLQNLHVLQIRQCPSTAMHALLPSNTDIPCQHLRQLLVVACDPEVLIGVISTRNASNAAEIPQISFQQGADDLHRPLPMTIQEGFAQLKIKILPYCPATHLQWRNYEVDDSEELVSAILDERWDVAGAVM